MQELTQQQCDRLAAELAPRVEGEVFFDPLRRALYSTDASIFQVRPAVVVLPKHAADVTEAVRFAALHGLPIGPRGAGSGVAGECLTGGLALDFTTHMHRVLSVDPAGAFAVAQAGCVFQQLNDRLGPTGKLFGPDPASGNRATLGGMVANNATGAHSIVYGHTSDHVRRIEAVLVDGSRAIFHADGRLEGESPLADRIREAIPALLGEWADRIAARWPRAPRNRAGYAVKGALNDGRVNWAQLLCGSEGTLAVFTAVELGLLDAPRRKTVVQANFRTLEDMAPALPAIIAAGASTCELLDATLMEMAREAYPDTAGVLPEEEASLVIEVDGPDEKRFARKLSSVLTALRGADGLSGEPVVLDDPAVQARLLEARKRAVPLLYRRRDGTKPVAVIEDVNVPVARMPEYLAGLRALAEDEDVRFAYYAHAGDGELHIRPYLDLYREEERRKLQRIARRTFELAWGLEGSVSGEHACGLARSGFLAEQFGELYDLFRRIKRTFDPDGLLNPDRIVTDTPGEELLVRDLRADHAPPEAPQPTELHFEGRDYTIEFDYCNGCGVCRGMERVARMCPVFRATRLEEATPRGKANLLRHLATGYLPEEADRPEALRAVADYCIGCRMCELECPSGVNVAKLMAEAKARLASRAGLPWVQKVLSRGEAMGRIGSLFGAVANLTLRAPGARWTMEKLTGVDRRRPMPPFAFRSVLGKLRRRAARRRPDRPVDRVVYFVDLFGTYHDHALAEAVVDVLTHNDVEVIVPDQKSAAMPMIAYGDVDAARKVIRYNLDRLAPAAREGLTIVCSEPTAALCLKREWLDVEHTDAAAAVADRARELTDYLLELHAADRLKTDFRPMGEPALAYHPPCHLRALHDRRGADLAELIDGVRVERLELSCCGIAGTFGFQKRKYDLSMAVGEPMLDALRNADAACGLTECSTCRMQMEFGAGKPTIHPAKLLSAAYGYRVKGLPPAVADGR